MPQRTNPFQELVAQIQRATAGKDVKVEESKFVELAEGEKKREVDVLIVDATSPYTIKCVYEAKDESRPMDLERLDAILGKYHLGQEAIKDVAIVTRRGYSKEAIKKAEKYGFKLFTLDEAKKIEWAKFLPPEVTLRSQVQIAKIEPKPPVTGPHRIQCSCGRDNGTIFDLVIDHLRAEIRDQNPTILEVDKMAHAGDGTPVTFIFESPGEGHVRSVVFEDGRQEKIESLSFTVVFTKRRPMLPMPVANLPSNWHHSVIAGMNIEPRVQSQGGRLTNVEMKQYDQKEINGKDDLSVVEIEAMMAGCPVGITMPEGNPPKQIVLKFKGKPPFQGVSGDTNAQ